MDLRRMFYSVLSLCGCLLASASAQAELLPHPLTVDQLPNGLSVVVVPFDSPGVAAYYTLVRTGSRDEVERGHSGYAHLFEHMMFRGTRTLDATGYEHRMQALGADNNAYTTEDFTLYTITLPSASLAGLIPIEADRFRNLSYAERIYQTETRAVLGEYNTRASNPINSLWENLAEVSFTRHTYGHTTMGYIADIDAMPREYEYSTQFFRRFYTPDNCTIIAVGDVHREQLLPLVRQHYGTWRGRRDNPRIPVEPEQTAPRSRALAWEGATTPRMLVGYRIPAFTLQTTDSAALEVVHALAFSTSSELYQRLVVREQKLLTLESWANDQHRDPQLLVVDAKLAGSTTFDEVQNAVQEELARIGRGEYARERIEAVISNLRYAIPMELQTADRVANSIARMMALTGDPHALERYHERLSTVTPDDVARVARTYLIPNRRNTITITDGSRAPADAVRVGPNARRSNRPGAPR